MRLPGVRGQSVYVRRALLPRRHPLHHLRPRSRLPLSLGGVAGRHRVRGLGGDDDLPRRAHHRPRLCLEERSARMGVILDPRHENPRPTDLQQPDPDYFNQLQAEVSDKGFLVTSTEDLFQWARSEEHTSELQSLMRISYAVFCLKKKNTHLETKST